MSTRETCCDRIHQLLNTRSGKLENIKSQSERQETVAAAQKPTKKHVGLWKPRRISYRSIQIFEVWNIVYFDATTGRCGGWRWRRRSGPRFGVLKYDVDQMRVHLQYEVTQDTFVDFPFPIESRQH